MKKVLSAAAVVTGLAFAAPALANKEAPAKEPAKEKAKEAPAKEKAPAPAPAPEKPKA